MTKKRILLHKGGMNVSTTGLGENWATMKFILALLAVLQLVVSCGEPNLDDPKVRDKIFAEAINKDILQIQRTPSGEEMSYAPNEQKPYEGWVKDQKQEQELRLLWLWRMMDGKKNGKWTAWYENGQMALEGSYQEDKKNGKWTAWYKNGQMASEGSYQEDKKNGKWTEWYENGQIFKPWLSSGSLKGRHSEAVIDDVYSMAFSPDGSILASGAGVSKTVILLLGSEGHNGTIKLWSVTKRQEITTLKGHGKSVNSVVFSPDGSILASGGGNGTIKLWSVAKRQEITTLKGHSSTVNSVVFSPDGSILASGSGNGTIKLWSVAKRQEITTLKGHGKSVNSVVFSPDGSILASGGDNGTIKLWSVAKRQEITTLKGHSSTVNSVVFSPDGSILASGSGVSKTVIFASGSGGEDGSIRLWSVAKRQEIATIKGHGKSVNSVVFSPDGSILTSGSGGSNGTIKLWSVAKRQEIATLGYISYDRRGIVNFVPFFFPNVDVAFSPDGLILAVKGSGMITLWKRPNSILD